MEINGSLYLSEIWIYPVKSLGGFRVPQAHVREAGLQFDRNWMITDQSGRFLTQREIPGMSLMNAKVVPEGLLLSREDRVDQILVPDSATLGELVSVKVWEDNLWAHTSEPWVNAWLSAQLGRQVLLVRLAEHADRPFLKNGVRAGALSFADDFPYHMIGQASLDDLNLRMDEAIGVGRFRPNMVIAGALPYDDDRWVQIRVGDVTFEIPSRCERCVMVNVDEGKTGKQPLKAMAAYRRDGRFIYFGQNMVASSLGIISEGDAVVVSSRDCR